MKKITLREISEILNEKELKNLIGGGSDTGGGCGSNCSHSVCTPFYHYFVNDCYYDGCDCKICGTTILYGDTAECLA